MKDNLTRQFAATRRAKRKARLESIINADPYKHLDIYIAMERKLRAKKTSATRNVTGLTPELLTYRFTLNNYCCELNRDMPLTTSIGTIKRRIPISISLDLYNSSEGQNYTPENTVISSLFANWGKNSCSPSEYALISGKDLKDLKNVQDLLFEPLPDKKTLELFSYKRLKALAEKQLGKLNKKLIVARQRSEGALYIRKQVV